MAERTLKTKILLRYDVLSNWTSKNPTLGQGEIAIVAIPDASSEMNVMGTTPPQILFKVGPGAFNNLEYASAKAADVYAWAKNPTLFATIGGEGNVVSSVEWDATLNENKGGLKFVKGVTAASKSELDALAARVTAEESKVDNDTTYTFTKGEKSIVITPSSGAPTTISFEYLTSDEVQGLINTSLSSYYTKADIDGFNFLKAADIADKADKSYVDDQLALKADKTALDSYYTKDEIDTTVGGLETEIGNKVAIADYDTKVAAIEGRLTTNEGEIDDIQEDIGEINTSVSNISSELAKKAVKTEVDTAIQKLTGDLADEVSRATGVEGGLNTRLGAVETSITTILNGTDPEKVDSLNELIDWVDTHGGEVSQIKADITANANAIDALEAKPSFGITDTDIANWNSAHGKEHVHTNQTVLDGISADDVDKWDAAEQNAKDYADGLNSALSGTVGGINNRLGVVEGKVSTIEGDYLKSSDKTELSGLISTEKGRIDDLVNETIPGLDGRIDVLEAKPFDTYATKSEVEAVDGKADGIDNRLKVVEGDYLKAADKTTLENAIANAEKSAKDYADGLNTAMDARVDVIEADFLSSKDVIIWDCGGAGE